MKIKVLLLIIFSIAKYETSAQEATTATTMAARFDVTRPFTTTPPDIETTTRAAPVIGVNPCSNSTFNNCSSNATCSNTTFGYTCTCLDGFSGDGFVCTDFDECSDASTNDCSEYATCTNLDFGFSCECYSGYYGNGTVCYEIPRLGPPKVISVGQTSVNVIVQETDESYKEFEIQVVNNNFATYVRTELNAIVENLNPFSTYIVASRVVKANGFTINDSPFSENVTFVTGIVFVPVSVVINIPFNEGYRDTASEVYKQLIGNYLSIILNLVNGQIKAFSVTDFNTLSIRPGSTIISGKLSTDSKNISASTTDLKIVSNSSDIKTIRSLPADIEAPNITEIEALTSLTVMIRYTSVSNATLYNIEVECENGFKKSFESTSEEILVTVSQSGSICSTKVNALIEYSPTEVVASTFSQLRTFTSLAKVSNMVVVTVGDQLFISFDQARRGKNYRVTTIPSSSDKVISQNDAKDGRLSVKIDGVSLSTNYTISVVPVFETANGSLSELFETGEATTKTIVTLDSLTVNSAFIFNIQETSFNIKYDAVKGATSYTIRYYKEGDLTLFNTTTTNTSTTISSVAPLINNYIVEVAYSVENYTSKFSLPLRTRIWNVSEVTQTSISLTWRNYILAKQYKIDYESKNSSKKQEQFTESNKMLLSKLDPGSLYSISLIYEDVSGFQNLVTFTQITAPSNPTGLSAVSSNKNATISWEAETKDTVVSITAAGEKDTSSITGVGTISGFETFLSPLIAGLTYTVKVCSRNGGGESCSSLDFQTDFPVPSNLNISKITQTSFVVSYLPLEHTKGYLVRVTGGNATLIMHTDETSITFTGLDSGTTYKASVLAKYISGNSNQSEHIEIITAPAEPENIELTKMEAEFAIITWPSVFGSDEYILILSNSTTNLFEDFKISDNATAEIVFNTNKVMNTTLKAGTNYTLFLKVKNEGGSSSTVNFTFTTKPAKPSDLILESVTQSSVEISFTAPLGAVSYQIEIFPTGRVETTTKTRFTIDGLSPGEDYNVSVIAIGRFQEGVGSLRSEPSDISFITVPNEVNNLTVNERTNVFLIVGFNESKNADEYEVIVTQGLIETTRLNASNPPVNITDLSPGSLYNISIIAKNKFGNSKPVLFEAFTRAVGPNVLNVSEVTTTTFTVSWEEPISVTKIRYYKTFIRKATELYSNSTITNITTQTFTDKQPSIVYTVKVSAFDDLGEIPDFGEVTVTTLPGPAKNLTVTSLTNESISFNWIADKTALYYEWRLINLKTSALIKNGNTPETFVDVTGLENAVGYIFNLKIVNPSGKGDISRVTATTIQYPFVAKAIFESNTNSSILVKVFPLVVGVESYVVTLKDETDKFLCLDNNTCLLENLESGTDYEIKVQGIYIAGEISTVGPGETFTTVPNAPKNITIKQLDFGINIEFDEVKGASFYQLQVLNSSKVMVKDLSSTVPSFDVTDLKSGTSYFVSFSATKNTSYGLFSSPLVLESVNTTKASPQNLVVTAVGSDFIQLEWNEIIGAENFVVIALPENTSISSSNLTTSNTIAQLSDLQPSQIYNILIQGIFSTGIGTYNSESLLQATGPAKPTGLKAVNVTNQEITLVWNDLSNVTGYTVNVTSAKGENYSTSVKSAKFIATSLNAGSIYQFQVIPFYGSVNGTLPSDILSVITAPLVKILENETVVTQNTIYIMYVKSFGAKSYELKVNQNGSLVFLTDVLNNFVLFEHENGIRPGIEYEICVTAITGNETGRRVRSEAKCTNATTKPGNSSTPIRIASTSTSITITYNSSAGASFYEITATNKLNSSDVVTVTSIETNVKIQNLQPASEYLINVTSVGVSGKSFSSPTLEVFTNPSPPIVSLTEISMTGLRLEWSVEPGVTKIVYRITDDISDNVLSSLKFVDISSLEPGTNYNISIFAQANGLTSEPTFISTITVPQEPSPITVLQQNSFSLEVEWKNVSGADVFFVSYQNSTDSGRNIAEIKVERNSIKLINLEPEQFYKIFVVASNPSGNSSEAEASFVTTAAFGPSISVTNSSRNEISFKLSEVVGVVGYNVSYSSSSSSNFVFVNETSGVLTSLLPGVKYNISASALYTVGASRFGKVLETITVPDFPKIISISVSSNTANVTWHEVSGAEVYEISIKPFTVGINGTGNVTSLFSVLTNLDFGLNYSVEICSVNIEGGSCTSEKFQTEMAQLTEAFTSNITQTSFVINFKPKKGAFNYTFEIFGDGGFFKMITANESPVNIIGLLPGNVYTISSTVLYNLGTSDKLEVTSQLTAPPNPRNFRVERIENSFALFKWDKSRSAEDYLLKIFDGFGIFLNSFIVKSEEADEISFTTKSEDTLLKSGTNYSISLQASNEAGYSEYLNISFQTKPAKPSDLILESVTQSSVEISFTAPLGAVSYQIEIFPTGRVETTTKTRFTIDGLSPGEDYNVSVIAIGRFQEGVGSLRSEPSDISFITAPENVSNFLGISHTSTSIVFTFDLSPTAIEYQLLVELDSLSYSNLTFTESPFTVTGLSPATTYNFTISAKNNFGESLSVTTTDYTRGENDFLIVLNDISDKSFSISWNTPTSISTIKGYNVNLRNIDSGEALAEKISFTNSIAFESLQPATNYQLDLSFIDEDGIIPKPTNFTILTKPGKTNGLKVNSQSSNSIEIVWNETKGVDDYFITVKDLSSEFKKNYTVTSSLLLTSGLTNGTEYMFIVYARNKAGSGPPVNISDFTIKKPFEIERSFVGSTINSIIIKLDSNVPGVETYFVEAGDIINSECGNNSVCIIMGLKSGTTYEVKVKGRYSSGAESELSSGSSYTTVPEKPKNLKATPTSESVNITYDRVEGASYYNLTLKQLEVISKVQTTDESYQFNELSPGEPYSVDVKSIKKFEGSEFVSESLSIEFETSTDIPANVQTLNITSRSIEIGWDSIPGIINYEALAVPVGSDSYNISLSTTATKANFGDLTPSKFYSFFVRGVYSKTKGLYSNPLLQNTGPAQVTNIKVESISTSQITISWQPVTLATAYIVQLSNGSLRYLTSSNTSFTTENNLKSGTVYSFMIKAVSGDIIGTIPSLVFRQITVPEEVKLDETSTIVTQTTISLKLDRPTGAQKFSINLSQNLKTILERISTNTINLFEFDDGVRPGQTYKICVVASTSKFNEIILESKEACVDVVTIPGNSSAPLRVSANENSITVRFGAIEGANYYIISVENERNSTNRKEINSTLTEVTVTDLFPATVYKFSVTPVGDAGKGFASDKTEIFTTPPSPLLFVDDVTNTSFTVRWEVHPLVDLVDYQIVDITDEDRNIIQTGLIPADDKKSVVVNELSPGKLYQIQAISSISGFLSTPKVTQQITIPSIPSNLRIVEQNFDEVSLKWEEVVGVEEYEVFYQEQFADTSNKLTVTTNNIIIKPLILLKNYEIGVLSKNKAGKSALISLNFKFTGFSPTPSINVDSVNRTSISVSFDPIDKATSYKVILNDIFSEQASTQKSFNKLLPGNQYNISFEAIFPSGVGFFSSIKTVYTETNPIELKLLRNSRDEGITIDVVFPFGSVPVELNGFESSRRDFVGELSTSGTITINSRLNTTYTFETQAENLDGLKSERTVLEVVTGNLKTFNLEVILNSSVVGSFTDELRNISSSNYEKLKTNVLGELTSAYNSYGLAKVNIIDFWNDDGKIAVWHQIIADRSLASAENFIDTFKNKSGFDKDMFVTVPTTELNLCLPKPCPTEANCLKVEEDTQCICPTGFTYKDLKCLDINECAVNSGGCGINSTCVNTNGSFDCRCKTGFSAVGSTCLNINECLVSDTCSVNARCRDSLGSFSCDCLPGFSGDGFVCENIDECSTSLLNNCSSNAECIDTSPSFTCTCNTGYTGNGSFCDDINECLDEPCPSNSNCENTDGGFICTCKPGYKNSSLGCIDKNECDELPCGSQAACTNLEGSFTCTCRVGYTGNPFDECSDINECSSNVCSINAKCSNNVGGYSCECNEGFTENGTQCLATFSAYVKLDPSYKFLDELSDSTSETYLSLSDKVIEQLVLKIKKPVAIQFLGFVEGVIAAFKVVNLNEADTINETLESFDKDVGDDTILSDHLTLITTDPPCEDPISTCGSNSVCKIIPIINTASCSCMSGYAGNPPVDECEAIRACITEPCHPEATCSDLSNGDYSCTCNDGFIGDGFNCNRFFTMLSKLNGSYTFVEALNNETSDEFRNLAKLVASEIRNILTGLRFLLRVKRFIRGSVIAETEVILTNSTKKDIVDAYNRAVLPRIFADTFIIISEPCLLSPCNLNEVCRNTSSREFECKCADGYKEDNRGFCIDIDECSADECDINSLCENTIGSFSCSCKSGFSGNGINCTDINECNYSPCGNRSVCNNIVGSFTCSCETGTRRLENNVCQDQCEGNYCLNGAKCVPTNQVGEPTCLCSVEYTGNRCDEPAYLRTVLIIVGVIGGLLLLLLIILIIIFIRKRKQRKLSFP